MFKQERHKMIRTYNEKDNEFLNENAPLAVLEILYHKDVITDSIVTSVDSEDNVNGVAYLKYHYTWNGENETYNRIVPSIYTKDDSVYNDLLEYAKKWLTEHTQIREGKKACLAIWEDSRKIASLQNHMHRGFMEYSVRAKNTT